jgi:hypothetical protein
MTPLVLSNGSGHRSQPILQLRSGTSAMPCLSRMTAGCSPGKPVERSRSFAFHGEALFRAAAWDRLGLLIAMPSVPVHLEKLLGRQEKRGPQQHSLWACGVLPMRSCGTGNFMFFAAIRRCSYTPPRRAESCGKPQDLRAALLGPGRLRPAKRRLKDVLAERGPLTGPITDAGTRALLAARGEASDSEHGKR